MCKFFHNFNKAETRQLWRVLFNQREFDIRDANLKRRKFAYETHEIYEKKNKIIKVFSYFSLFRVFRGQKISSRTDVN